MAAAEAPETPAAEPADEAPPRVDAFRSVTGLENWEYLYDISGYEKGKYNLIVRGTDQAGNEYLEGPYNIVIDPESDLPVVTLSNPLSGMRVGGNLNIVGTCIDDDAVAKVEVSIDDGPFSEVSGTDFWSFYLDTTEMKDGMYAIHARGIDINGVVGHNATVEFHLDTAKPLIGFESHESGELVNGRIVLTGTVSDPNGVERVEVRPQDQEEYQRISFSGERDAKSVQFQLRVNTQDLPDGPQIYWFRAVDRTGSVGRSAFLFFVDNEQPEINILYPTADGEVNGKFTVVGTFSDQVGVESLTWTLKNEEPVDIPLTPGNPYWSQEFDFSGQKSADITFMMTDRAGNITSERLRLKLDIEGDKPTVIVVRPAQDSIAALDFLSGFVHDDDGVRSIIYSVDGAEERSVEASKAFDIELPRLESGKHTLSVRAQDINGVEGDTIKIGFIKALPAPVISLSSINRRDGESEEFGAGMEIITTDHASLGGTVLFQNPKGEVRYAIADAEPAALSLKRTDVPGEYGFTVPIPADDIPYGYVRLIIEAEDEYGGSSRIDTGLLIKDLTKIQADHGLYSADHRTDDITAPIKLDAPLPLRYIGFPAVSVVLRPDSDIVSVSERDGFVEIRPAKEGITRPVTLEVMSEKGRKFVVGPAVFDTDFTRPSIELAADFTSGKISGTAALAGVAADNVAIAEARYIIGDKSTPVSPTRGDAGWELSASISASAISDPGSVVAVEVVDTSGNRARDYRVFQNAPRFVPDPEAKSDPKPVVHVLAPQNGVTLFAEDLVEGRVYAAGVITGVAGVKSITYALDGGEERTLTGGDVFELRLVDLTPGSHSITFRATSDKDATSSAAKTVFSIAKPPVSLVLDKLALSDESSTDFRPGMKIERISDYRLQGYISAGRKVAGSVYTIDGGEEATLRTQETEGGGRSFSIPIRSGWDLGIRTVSITLTDEYDHTIRHSAFFFLTQPAGERKITEKEGMHFADERFLKASTGPDDHILLSPGDEVAITFVGRPVTKFAMEPENGIADVEERGGQYYLRARETGMIPALSFSVETRDGDPFSAGPYSIVIDGEKPAAALDSSITDIWVRDTLSISGAISDDVGIQLIEYAVIKGPVPTADEAPAPAGNANYRALPFAADRGQPVTRIPFSLDMPIGDLPDGDIEIRVRLTDLAGRKSTQSHFLQKDTAGPEVIQLTPAAGDAVNGFINLIARTPDGAILPAVEFSDDGMEFVPVAGLTVFSHGVDLASYAELPERFYLRLTDQAGNQTLFNPNLDVNLESDKPSVEIQIPERDSLIRNDFVISGVVFDDDGVSKIFYRIDDGEFIELEGSNNFEIAVSLENITDNEHTVEVKAADLGGVESEIAQSIFIVSKSEPLSRLIAPEIDVTLKGVVTISGESSDANGIKEVFISFDNGNTFNRMIGAEDWSYTLDTRTLLDDTYSLLIKAVDNTNVEGLYTTLLNVDNTPPELQLSGPFDGEQVAETMLLQGRVEDSIGLDQLSLIIQYLGPEPGDILETTGETTPQGSPAMSLELEPNRTVLRSIDVRGLSSGWYNLRMSAVDRADNIAYISRNFEKIAAVQYSRIDVLFPAPGEKLAGDFMFQGRLDTVDPPEKATLYIDNKLYEAIDVNRFGYFSASISPDRLSTGEHTAVIEARLNDGATIKSMEQVFEYERYGPWVLIDNFSVGDFASNRPWIEGRAGIFTSELPADEKAVKELEKSQEVTQVAYSLDNGRSFKTARGKETWRFRLETQDLPDAPINLIVRAQFRNGTKAVAKTQVVIDDTVPAVTLIAPQEGMRFNEEIKLIGTAFDASGLRDVSVALRKGDKNQYEVPEFVQGLYVDTHFLGSTYWEAGVGLTFFDDNVKLQVGIGTSPTEGQRFSGLVLTAKLLANIAVLPYSFFFGPDLDFLSSGFAIGAAFSYFTMSEGSIAFTEQGLVLAAVIGQLELARLRGPWRVFNAFSIYVEGQIWFISSDVEGGVKPLISFGVRSEVF